MNGWEWAPTCCSMSVARGRGCNGASQRWIDGGPPHLSLRDILPHEGGGARAVSRARRPELETGLDGGVEDGALG